MSDDHADLLFYSVPSLPSSRRAPMDKQMRALRLAVCLLQLFGALLLTPIREGGVEYKTDNVITVRVQEDSDLSCLLHNVRTLDVPKSQYVPHMCRMSLHFTFRHDLA
jgi:hypothetical protein